MVFLDSVTKLVFWAGLSVGVRGIKLLIRGDMSEWINAKAELPPKLEWGQYETYIVTDGKYVFMAIWLMGKFCRRPDGCSDLVPTHWMPLPEPPANKKGGN